MTAGKDRHLLNPHLSKKFKRANTGEAGLNGSFPRSFAERDMDYLVLSYVHDAVYNSKGDGDPCRICGGKTTAYRYWDECGACGKCFVTMRYVGRNNHASLP